MHDAVSVARCRLLQPYTWSCQKRVFLSPSRFLKISLLHLTKGHHVYGPNDILFFLLRPLPPFNLQSFIQLRPSLSPREQGTSPPIPRSPPSTATGTTLCSSRRRRSRKLPTSPHSRRSPLHCGDGGGGSDWAPSPPRRCHHSSSPTRLPTEVKFGTCRRRSKTPPPNLGDSNDFGSPRDRHTPPDRFHWTRRSPENWTRSPQQNGRWKEVSPEKMATVTTTRGDWSAWGATNPGGSRRLAGKDEVQLTPREVLRTPRHKRSSRGEVNSSTKRR